MQRKAENKSKNDRARRRRKEVLEEKKWSSETEDHQKQHLATLKRLKRGDKNELERRLEKIVSSKHLRLAMEMEEERRARLENDAILLYLNIVLIFSV